MRIVVLAGGTSAERDVSLSSGARVRQALCERGHLAVLADVYLGIDLPELDPDEYFETAGRAAAETGKVAESVPDIAQIKAARPVSGDGFFGRHILNICKAADLAFMALHGENGENGRIQAAFDLLEIKYTGSGHLASALAMDKGLAKKLLRSHNLPVPAGCVLNKAELPHIDVKAIDLPCVVKPCCGGSSIGVSIAHTSAELEKALAEAFRYEDTVIAEDYIAGREFSVGVIAGRALPVIELIPKEGFYDYKNKYQPGLTEEICPARIEEPKAREMQEIAAAVHAALGLEVYSRVDFMMSQAGEIFCLEANTLPGMTPTSLIPQEAAVEGISYGELCELIISESLKRWA
ncbi:MAG: D-alanine--D-alanine ligase [Oscillospiraceae bacterium]|nr:D-alanine--D-alanine ligase [Oscillospiraceae bacterium]